MRAVPPRHWPLGLFGMLALVLSVEIWLGLRDSRFTTISPLQWIEAIHRVKLARGSAIVAMGDSLVSNGVIPEVIESHLGTGRSVYNLALGGGPFSVTYFLFRRLVESGPAPEAVVVDGQSLTSDARDLVMPRPWYVLHYREIADLARTFQDPAFFAENATRKFIASLRHRATIRSMLVARVTGKEFIDPIHFWFFIWGWNQNKGSHVLTDRERNQISDPLKGDQSILDLFRGDWRCNQWERGYVERFLTLAEAKHVRVYWLMMPDEPVINALRERDGWWSAYAGFLHDLQSRHSNLVVIDGHRAGYPPEAMSDLLHLSRTGAITFSDSLGSILARADNPSRWIALPRYESERARVLAARSTVRDFKMLARDLAEKNAGKPGTVRR